ncbi:hypothetical protein CAL7716_057020 [Calothrix sp. PCC 7716]|nr:hypothetical protein CAL7716_057020 [Calothrix sp. PCC 7716]
MKGVQGLIEGNISLDYIYFYLHPLANPLICLFTILAVNNGNAYDTSYSRINIL